MSKRKLELGPRNDPLGLARRSFENLQLVEHMLATRKEGHVVTQVVQSLLAIVVFPQQKDLYGHLQRWDLNSLDGRWPNLRPIIDNCEKKTTNLYRVLYHMRNAVCHGLVTFYGDGPEGSDTRELSEIIVEFSDRENENSPINWTLQLGGEDLRALCERLIEVIED
jgi:HEPN pEK499 p136